MQFHCYHIIDTLPPFPQTTRSTIASTSIQTTERTDRVERDSGETSTLSIPTEQRGYELTFRETGQETTFLFAQNNTFIQMDGDVIQTFQLR